MIKPGDKVRLIEKQFIAFHPTGKRFLKKGEIITVASIINGNIIRYDLNNGNNNDILMEWVELVDECTCDIIPLVNNGCKCGFLQREKELI